MRILSRKIRRICISQIEKSYTVELSPDSVHCAIYLEGMIKSYLDLLDRSGVSYAQVSRLDVQQNSAATLTVVLIQEYIKGPTVAEILNSRYDGFVRVGKNGILNFLLSLFRDILVECEKVERINRSGRIDLNTENFVYNEEANVVLVDVFPPLYEILAVREDLYNLALYYLRFAPGERTADLMFQFCKSLHELYALDMHPSTLVAIAYEILSEVTAPGGSLCPPKIMEPGMNLGFQGLRLRCTERLRLFCSEVSSILDQSSWIYSMREISDYSIHWMQDLLMLRRYENIELRLEDLDVDYYTISVDDHVISRAFIAKYISPLVMGPVQRYLQFELERVAVDVVRSVSILYDPVGYKSLRDWVMIGKDTNSNEFIVEPFKGEKQFLRKTDFNVVCYVPCDGHRPIQSATLVSPKSVTFILGELGYPSERVLIRYLRELQRRQYQNQGGSIYHSSGVSKDGATCLMMGEKGAGKTTLMLKLCSAGFDFVANDRVALFRDFSVRGLPLPVRIDPKSLSSFSDRIDAFRYLEQLRSTQGDGKVELYPEEFCSYFANRVIYLSNLKCIIFPRIILDVSGVFAATLVSTEMARLLIEQSCFTPKDESWFDDWFGLDELSHYELSASSRAMTEVLSERMPSYILEFSYDLSVDILANFVNSLIEDS